MRILSWNLNGLKACLNRDDFKQLKALPLPDVICFQETRTKERPVVFLVVYHHSRYLSQTYPRVLAILSFSAPLFVHASF